MIAKVMMASGGHFVARLDISMHFSYARSAGCRTLPPGWRRSPPNLNSPTIHAGATKTIVHRDYRDGFALQKVG